MSQFHATDDSGYAFWAEQVIALNKLDLQLTAAKGLYKDVQEVAGRTLV